VNAWTMQHSVLSIVKTPHALALTITKNKIEKNEESYIDQDI